MLRAGQQYLKTFHTSHTHKLDLVDMYKPPIAGNFPLKSTMMCMVEMMLMMVTLRMMLLMMMMTMAML